MDIVSKRVVLAVDDNASNLRLIEETLRDKYKVHTAPSGEWAMGFLKKRIAKLNPVMPDLILLDVRMPGMDGYQFIKELKNTPETEDIPVIFLTASEGMDEEIEAFKAGAVDYIKKPIIEDILIARVSIQLELSVYRKQLEEMVFDRTRKLQLAEDGILSLLANVSSYRDQETGGHVRRTTEYVRVLVQALQREVSPGHEYYINSAQGNSIIKSAKLHDIGKVAIADAILLKPGKLSAEEFAEMKNHTTLGANMIDDAIRDLTDDSFLSVAREIVVAHHEKWNGMGYPYGLKGSDIPLSARLMAIGDVYDALISKRPYKEPFSHEKALSIIYSDAGTHFDPNVLEMAKQQIDRFDEIAQKITD
ncbi:two-component system response regulator [Clostridia bacterium]|nr:two-component system response regulator [Clostridia bacterium]